MLRRQKSGSVVCPGCGRLVGVKDAKCFNCGRPAPALWGFAPALQGLANNLSFTSVVIGGCGLLYLLAILLRPSALAENQGFLTLFSPGLAENALLGSSGALPIFKYGRWWTVLSAAWLHGGLLHIGFNMYWLSRVGQQVVEILGLGRTVMVYTAGAVLGFAGTSFMFFMPLPSFLHGAPLTLGASASLCGLVGGLYAYAQKGGVRALHDYVKQFAVSILIFGLLIDGVDNWAHIFGFLGGYLAALALRPLEDENALHMVGALLCMLAFVASIAASVIYGQPIYRDILAQM